MQIRRFNFPERLTKEAERLWMEAETGQERRATLTDRERQVIRLISEGLSNKQIARRLNVTDGTIKVHLHHIFEKLRVDNRTTLAAVYLSQRTDQSDHE